MKTYQSHKIVQAVKCSEVRYGKNSEEGIGRDNVHGYIELIADDNEVYQVPYKIFARGEPTAGFYIVEYEDGYLSWSPAEAFEKGYKQCGALNFGAAIAALKEGKRVARTGWNGKGMWLVYVSTDDEVRPEGSPYYSLFLKEGGKQLSTSSVLPWIGMKTATGDFVPWLASQTDVLAEDWEIV